MSFFSQQIRQLIERKMDPLKLAQRVSRRYGTATSFGPWEKVPKGGHIPLTSFDETLSGDAAEALFDFQEKLGMEDPDKKTREAAEKKYNNMHKKMSLDIKSLIATQPYVMANDVEKLKKKIDTKAPSHIHVVKYKGKYFVSDGHHAIVAAQLRGDKKVDANVIDVGQ